LHHQLTVASRTWMDTYGLPSDSPRRQGVLRGLYNRNGDKSLRSPRVGTREWLPISCYCVAPMNCPESLLEIQGSSRKPKIQSYSLTPTTMLVDYGSGSESGSEDEKPIVTSKTAPVPSTRATAVDPSGVLSLPPPNASTDRGNALPSPSLRNLRPRRRDGPVKITLEAPKRAAEDDGADTLARPSKRVKLEGAGSSSLMSMLPAPSSKAPLPPPRKGKDSASVGLQPNSALDELLRPKTKQGEESAVTEAKATAFVPPSLVKGKTRVNEEPGEPAVDFFSISKSNPHSISFRIKPLAFRRRTHGRTQTPCLVIKNNQRLIDYDNGSS
jgi:hypothetical protein